MRVPATLLAALGLLLAACAPPVQLAQHDDPKPPEQPNGDGGIGGTGLFGTVTDLGSVDVNGLRVRFDAGTVILPETILDVGATLLIEARRTTEGLMAQRMASYHPLIGPVERIDPANGTIVVMGTPVDLQPDLRVYDRSGGLIDAGRIEVGTRVAVSGIWRGDRVVASRLDLVPEGSPAVVSGLLREDLRGARIGATFLDLACCRNLAEGQFVRFEGVYRDGLLVPSSRAVGERQLFSPRIEQLIVEAYLAPNEGAPGFHLAGFGILMDPASPEVPPVDQRALLIGPYDGEFRIERSLTLPGDAAERDAFLNDLELDDLL